MAVYKFDKPRPGEDVLSYLARHHAHPDDPNAREATEEEMAACDRTNDFTSAGLTGVVFFPEEPVMADPLSQRQTSGEFPQLPQPSPASRRR